MVERLGGTPRGNLSERIAYRYKYIYTTKGRPTRPFVVFSSYLLHKKMVIFPQTLGYLPTNSYLSGKIEYYG